MTLAAVAIGGRAGVGSTPMAWAMVVLVGAMLAIHARIELPDVVFILVSGALSVAVLGSLAG